MGERASSGWKAPLVPDELAPHCVNLGPIISSIPDVMGIDRYSDTVPLFHDKARLVWLTWHVKVAMGIWFCGAPGGTAVLDLSSLVAEPRPTVAPNRGSGYCNSSPVLAATPSTTISDFREWSRLDFHLVVFLRKTIEATGCCGADISRIRYPNKLTYSWHRQTCYGPCLVPLL